ncbi:phage tail protein [Celerinatantimonas sp. MCCC 1A17872]|uniref:phage tail protein n=1 Tax=Celerinatantimonas sp. MCCC 1A17872 TaxID=3177514 RepID=UPI0038C21C1E
MQKLTDLRAHLLSRLPELKQNPDKLLLFIENGHLCATAHYSRSFEYRYTATLIITDFASHLDAFTIALFDWVRTNQSELMTNSDKLEAIEFEAEINDNVHVDFILHLPLTESVSVIETDQGLQVEHLAEPQLEEELPSDTALTLIDPTGQPITTWNDNDE